MQRTLGLTLTAGALLGATLTPTPAQACGGTFCDSGPTAMPVDQSGENILFVMDGDHVEAHVQIQYEGSAERFAWIVPMPEIPEVSVGSQRLFENLLRSSVPSYGQQLSFDQCGVGAGQGGTSSGGSGGSASGGGSGGSSGGGGPTVVFRESVGSFEVVALQGGTATEVVEWLDTNGYQNVDSAPALLNKYVQKGFVFVALKLSAGADTDEIHPLVFRYQGDEPCVPIELTAVAAVEDMGIRTFFLGDDRVVPTNYKHVTLNPARLDWLQSGANYTQTVSRAVDSPIASGHAFVTEYAGNSSIVPTFDIRDAAWSVLPLSDVTPETLIDILEQQNLILCNQWDTECSYNHPLLRPLLEQYLPVPEGMTDVAFYDCVACWIDRVDDEAWDAVKLAEDFSERIVEPGDHALNLLGKYPYLTRMFTTMSPSEMTEDPMFHARADLPEVDNRSVFATQRVTCDGEQGMQLPDGREVGLQSSAQWPAFNSNMPWAETVTAFTPDQEPVVLVDNSGIIDEELSKWNQTAGWPPENPGSPGTGGSGAGASNPVGGSGPALASGGSGADSGSDGGCQLSVGDAGRGVGLAGLFALGLLGYRRRATASR